MIQDLDFNFLSVDSEVSGDAMLVDALNINAGNFRVPFPDGTFVKTIPEIGGVSTQGFLRYGLTDAGQYINLLDIHVPTHSSILFQVLIREIVDLIRSLESLEK